MLMRLIPRLKMWRICSCFSPSSQAKHSSSSRPLLKVLFRNGQPLIKRAACCEHLVLSSTDEKQVTWAWNDMKRSKSLDEILRATTKEST